MKRFLIIALILTGCRKETESKEGDEVVNPGPYALTVVGEDFSKFNGRKVQAALLRNDVIDLEATTQVIENQFSFTWTAALDKGRTYEVAVFLDVNTSQWCEPSVDRPWLVEVTATEDATLTIAADDATNDDACDGFPPPDSHDITFAGLEYTHAEGTDVHAVLLDDNGDVALSEDGVIDTSGVFGFDWPGGAEHDASYTLIWWIDIDADGSCTVADEAFDLQIGPVRSDQIVGGTYNASSGDTGLCASL
jgi:hypothetical protein